MAKHIITAIASLLLGAAIAFLWLPTRYDYQANGSAEGVSVYRVNRITGDRQRLRVSRRNHITRHIEM